MRNPLFFVFAWICTGLAALGVFLPVLPTTPFLLLAAFLFARSSPKCHAWLCKTRIYRSYVLPFLEQGGISFKKKIHILAVSFSVMGISAFLVQRPLVWGILGAVALFLLWLMIVRIPTVGKPQQQKPQASPVKTNDG